MAAVSTIIAAVGVAAAVGGTVLQQQASKSAQKQSQRQFEESNALRREAETKSKQLSDLQSVRARRAAVREAQLKQAEVVNQGAGGGVSESSPVQGAVSSIGTQAGVNVSFLDTANQLQGQAATLFGQAQEIGNRPIFTNTFGSSVASFGSALFKGSDTLGGIFNSVFSSTPAAATNSNAGFYPQAGV